MADRLRHCVNADVPGYGNMQDRADKELQWLRAHKKEYFEALSAHLRLSEELKSAVDALDLDNLKFLEGFRWTFSVGHAAGCRRYEKQLATQVASATRDDALIDSCLSEGVQGAQVMKDLKLLPDFELKEREKFGDPNFVVGVTVGVQRGVVDGCLWPAP